MLEKQVKVYALDTGNFYSNAERRLHWHINRIKADKRSLVKRIESIEKECADVGLSVDEVCLYDEVSLLKLGMSRNVARYATRYRVYKDAVRIKNAAASDAKKRLLSLLLNKVDANVASNGTHHVRELDEDSLSDGNVIAVFDSYFTRTIGARQDELCEDFMVVTKFYDDVMKDLIYYGFTYKGEKYVYFTSSAGQIRTKKTVFVKESVWKRHERTIMCGLTLDDINAKGGNNPNKHLAYLALANSATDVWREFDIDKTIVIDDFETEVYGTYDFVDDVDYSVTRTSGHVPIEHTDGAGMMLPNAFGAAQKNKMVRLPWVKGLLGVFDFRRFVEENGCSPIIEDIYGKKHDVVAEDIQVIFCKSQFKLNKHYDSWEQYKELYKRYGCTAGVTNIEEDRIKDATINYQMLQSLTDVTDDEILEIAKESIDRIGSVCSSVADMKRTIGITPYNENKTAFQKAIDMYPDLLNDKYAKEHVKSIKDSMVKRAKAGKLNVRGKYTFVLPDFYAACERWFAGVENPEGLIDDGEVFCWLFRKSDKLDCLRSPHLYKEHPIRRNVACFGYGERQARVREWFCTDAIYISCKDLISRIVQLDCDGDKLLVVSDKKLIEVAERNMDGIVPLYYDMKKAGAVHLDSSSIYAGLNAAFTSGNIGIYSNNISKIWNSDVFVNGTEEERQRAVDIVKLLCMENNFCIDAAKTLYMPERPEHVKDVISSFTKEKLPHFFVYAKDKCDDQVVACNESFVNKLERMIPNPKINCRKLGLGKIDYTLMMDNPDIECVAAFTDKGKLIKDETDPLIVKYCDFDREYYFSVDAAISSEDDQLATDRFAKKALRYRQMAAYIKTELSQFGYNDREVTDILVKFLYGMKNAKNKTVLWMCYGDYIVENLERYFKPQTKAVQCVDCGKWFDVGIFDSATERCCECAKEHKRELARLRKRRQRENQRHATP